MKKTSFILILFLINIFSKTQAGSGTANQNPLLVSVGDSKLTLVLTQLQAEATAAGSGNVYSFTMNLRVSDVNSAALNYLHQQFLKCEKFFLVVFDMDINFSLNEIRSYPDAILTEFTLPALDGASKDQAEIKLKMKATSVTTKSGGGAIQKFSNVGKKSALAGNFKIKLGGLPSNRVSAISKLTFKTLSSVQQKCDSISDISIKVSQADAQPWRDWFDSRATGITKKSGEIQLLAANMKDVIATFYISNVEIISFASSTSTTNEQIQRATVGLRIGRAEVKF